MVCEPIIFFMSIYLTFVYSLLYLFFFAFPISFAEIRGFSGGITGTTFVRCAFPVSTDLASLPTHLSTPSIMIGIVIAMCFMPRQETRYKAVTADGAFPEARLYPVRSQASVLCYH